jgi:hypothetical protein
VGRTWCHLFVNPTLSNCSFETLLNVVLSP